LIAFALTAVIFTLTGHATAWLLRVPLPDTRAARLALKFLLGAGMQGTFLYALGVLHVPLNGFAFSTLPVVAGLVGGWRLAVGGKGQLTTTQTANRQLPTANQIVNHIAFFAPLFALLLATTILPIRDYDGRVTWLPKARAIALEHAIDGPFFHGERGLNLHNRYPLLIPLDVASVMALSGDTRNETGRWLYLFIALSALIVMRDFLRASFGATGAWVSAAVVWLPLLTTIEGGALAAYNDFAIAAFIGIAVLSLIDGDARVAGLFVAFAIMTKNEGAALAVAVLMAAVLTRRFRWTMLVPIAIAEALVVIARRLVPAAYDEQYEVLVTALPHSMRRVPDALFAIVRQASDVRQWGLFWFVVALSVIAGFFVAREKRFAIPLITIMLALGAYVVALSVTSWNIAELAPVAVDRLLAHLLMPAATIVALVLHSLREAG
jgi:hypothetical protein